MVEQTEIPEWILEENAKLESIEQKERLPVLKFEERKVTTFKVDFSKKFDEFLYLIVGYPTLTQLTPTLFVSPYGATSLREYFANCFEEYFARRQYDHVKKISPAVYEKIELLLGI